VSDCSYGLELPPTIVETNGTAVVETVVYEDCSRTPDDEDCVESWDIKCASIEVSCLTAVVRDSCVDSDIDCQVNFLRAFCARFSPDVCMTEPFQQGLKKRNGCLPGNWKCIGFQEMFGGPKGVTECVPWDLKCALKD